MRLDIFNNNDYSFVFTEKGKENYFRSKFHQFKESAEKLNGMNLNDFSTGSNDIEETVRVLNNLFYEEYRNYVSTEEGDITTFDEFIRYAEIEQNYYIGGILKYHY